jgi:hypothetical protein
MEAAVSVVRRQPDVSGNISLAGRVSRARNQHKAYSTMKLKGIDSFETSGSLETTVRSSQQCRSLHSAKQACCKARVCPRHSTRRGYECNCVSAVTTISRVPTFLISGNRDVTSEPIFT